MPVNGYTTGRDVTVTMVSGSGTIVISSDQITKFFASPGAKQEWGRRLKLPPSPLYIPELWHGSIHVDRQDATLDTFQSDLETNFWNGEDTLGGTILQTVTENNGSVTQYQFNNVMFWLDDPGGYGADSKVQQVFYFAAGQRIRVK